MTLFSSKKKNLSMVLQELQMSVLLIVEINTEMCVLEATLSRVELVCNVPAVKKVK